MRIDIITLFEDWFKPFLNAGVTKRAFEGEEGKSSRMTFKCWNPREFASGPYKRVDDRPFGGGPGMVMMAEPLSLCVQAIRHERVQLGLEEASEPAPVILFTPVGERITHLVVERECARAQGAIWICGRYEGVDQRFIDAWVDVELSLGDFVLSGGEIPALALLDAMARLQPGVLSDELSHVQDSFNPRMDGLLDCPHYTRPEHWQGQSVPSVLLSGHHGQIEAWRREQSLALTQARRPELLDLVTQGKGKPTT